ncbi:MAG: hypothetical protein WDM80_11840 [Limisphaerales bacterium]
MRASITRNLKLENLAAGESRLGELNHLRRSVQSRDRPLRQGVGDFRRDLAIAAANVKDVFIATQLKFGDEFARPGMLHDGVRGVVSRVPSRRLGNF